MGYRMQVHMSRLVSVEADGAAFFVAGWNSLELIGKSRAKVADIGNFMVPHIGDRLPV